LIDLKVDSYQSSDLIRSIDTSFFALAFPTFKVE